MGESTKKFRCLSVSGLNAKSRVQACAPTCTGESASPLFARAGSLRTIDFVSLFSDRQAAGHKRPVSPIDCPVLTVDVAVVVFDESSPKLAASFPPRQEYSKAVGLTITFRDIPVDAWRDAPLESGLPADIVNTLRRWPIGTARDATTEVESRAHANGAGQLSLQEFVRMNAGTFTAAGKLHWMNEWEEEHGKSER